MDEIRVLIVDDHPMFREAVARTIGDEPGMAVVAGVDNCADAVQKARDTLPDIVLQDLKLPDGSGLDVLRHLQTECPYSKVIVLTAVEDEDALLEALKLGARGYVLKGVSSAELVQVTRSVATGGTYVTPTMAGRLLKEMTDRGQSGEHGTAGLTDRERGILELVGEGLTNREIADRLFLSEKTVKHYMTNVLEKLHVRNRVQAALLLKAKKGGA
jgi:DNA-binding NarL/FixJ family response regulator